uniref:Uncharacterized protein n=1 Tax=Vespula pensylvanica TaxID=30213 RepID=A0A834NZ23_VESPE|nr:hypothetical protein H0235_009542 [Vespula pensylvanica]
MGSRYIAIASDTNEYLELEFGVSLIKLRMAPKWNALSPYRPMPRTENKKKKKRKRKKRKAGKKEQGRGRGVGDDDDGGGGGGGGVARGGSDAKYNRNREKGIFWLTSSLTRIADCCSAASNKFERIFGEQQHHQEAGLYVADSCGWKNILSDCTSDCQNSFPKNNPVKMALESIGENVWSSIASSSSSSSSSSSNCNINSSRVIVVVVISVIVVIVSVIDIVV